MVAGTAAAVGVALVNERRLTPVFAQEPAPLRPMTTSRSRVAACRWGSLNVVGAFTWQSSLGGARTRKSRPNAFPKGKVWAATLPRDVETGSNRCWIARHWAALMTLGCQLTDSAGCGQVIFAVQHAEPVKLQQMGLKTRSPPEARTCGYRCQNCWPGNRQTWPAAPPCRA